MAAPVGGVGPSRDTMINEWAGLSRQGVAQAATSLGRGDRVAGVVLARAVLMSAPTIPEDRERVSTILHNLTMVERATEEEIARTIEPDLGDKEYEQAALARYQGNADELRREFLADPFSERVAIGSADFDWKPLAVPLTQELKRNGLRGRVRTLNRALGELKSRYVPDPGSLYKPQKLGFRLWSSSRNEREIDERKLAEALERQINESFPSKKQLLKYTRGTNHLVHQYETLKAFLGSDRLQEFRAELDSLLTAAAQLEDALSDEAVNELNNLLTEAQQLLGAIDLCTFKGRAAVNLFENKTLPVLVHFQQGQRSVLTHQVDKKAEASQLFDAVLIARASIEGGDLEPSVASLTRYVLERHSEFTPSMQMAVVTQSLPSIFASEEEASLAHDACANAESELLLERATAIESLAISLTMDPVGAAGVRDITTLTTQERYRLLEYLGTLCYTVPLQDIEEALPYAAALLEGGAIDELQLTGTTREQNHQKQVISRVVSEVQELIGAREAANSSAEYFRLVDRLMGKPSDSQAADFRHVGLKEALSTRGIFENLIHSLDLQLQHVEDLESRDEVTGQQASWERSRLQGLRNSALVHYQRSNAAAVRKIKEEGGHKLHSNSLFFQRLGSLKKQAFAAYTEEKNQFTPISQLYGEEIERYNTAVAKLANFLDGAVCPSNVRETLISDAEARGDAVRKEVLEEVAGDFPDTNWLSADQLASAPQEVAEAAQELERVGAKLGASREGNQAIIGNLQYRRGRLSDGSGYDSRVKQFLPEYREAYVQLRGRLEEWQNSAGDEELELIVSQHGFCEKAIALLDSIGEAPVSDEFDQEFSVCRQRMLTAKALSDRASSAAESQRAILESDLKELNTAVVFRFGSQLELINLRTIDLEVQKSRLKSVLTSLESETGTLENAQRRTRVRERIQTIEHSLEQLTEGYTLLVRELASWSHSAEEEVRTIGGGGVVRLCNNKLVDEEMGFSQRTPDLYHFEFSRLLAERMNQSFSEFVDESDTVRGSVNFENVFEFLTSGGNKIQEATGRTSKGLVAYATHHPELMAILETRIARANNIYRATSFTQEHGPEIKDIAVSDPEDYTKAVLEAALLPSDTGEAAKLPDDQLAALFLMNYAALFALESDSTINGIAETLGGLGAMFKALVNAAKITGKYEKGRFADIGVAAGKAKEGITGIVGTEKKLSKASAKTTTPEIWGTLLASIGSTQTEFEQGMDFYAMAYQAENLLEALSSIDSFRKELLKCVDLSTPLGEGETLANRVRSEVDLLLGNLREALRSLPGSDWEDADPVSLVHASYLQIEEALNSEHLGVSETVETQFREDGDDGAVKRHLNSQIRDIVAVIDREPTTRGVKEWAARGKLPSPNPVAILKEFVSKATGNNDRLVLERFSERLKEGDDARKMLTTLKSQVKEGKVSPKVVNLLGRRAAHPVFYTTSDREGNLTWLGKKFHDSLPKLGQDLVGEIIKESKKKSS